MQQALATKLGLSLTSVTEMAIRLLAEREGLSTKGGESDKAQLVAAHKKDLAEVAAVRKRDMAEVVAARKRDQAEIAAARKAQAARDRAKVRANTTK
jgi:hypothetical protein